MGELSHLAFFPKMKSALRPGREQPCSLLKARHLFRQQQSTPPGQQSSAEAYAYILTSDVIASAQTVDLDFYSEAARICNQL